MLPPVTRPGICYYCRKRAGTESYRSLFACKQCVLAKDVQDALVMIVLVVVMATLVGMTARRIGHCKWCPDVPMPVLHLLNKALHQ